MSPLHYVFVESNTTGSGRLVVEQLLAAGHSLTFLTRSPEIYPFLAAHPGLAVENLETNDTATVLQAVGRASRARPVDAIVTFSNYYVPIVAEVAARLGLRFLAQQAARTCYNKLDTRRALQSTGLPNPDFWSLSSFEEAERLSGSIPYPCVVKSPCESSSRGVRLVTTPAELIAHFSTLHAWTKNARDQELSGEVLVESLLEGPEYSVETVTLARGDTRVVGITTKHLSDPPLFVEIGHDFPSEIPGETAAALAGCAVAALDAVGYDFGPAHTEIRFTPTGPVVVEINPRLAGGMIPELVRHATGIDLLSAFVDQLSGRRPDLTPVRREHASIRFFLAPVQGRLRGVRGGEAARQLPTIKELSIGKPIGAMVYPAEEATNRVGYVIASGPDRRSMLTDIGQAWRQVELEIDPSAADTL